MENKKQNVLEYLDEREAGNPQLASAVRVEFNKLEFVRIRRQRREAKQAKSSEHVE